MKLPIIKITKEEDLNLITNGKECHVEIYVHNLCVNLNEIKGSLIVRAINCQFPNLHTVNENLSVDGSENIFPKLTVVKGNVNIHEQHSKLPNLKIILGDLKVLEPIDLSRLEFVNGKKQINSDGVILSDQIKKINDTNWIEVQNQSELDKILNNSYLNIRIRNNSFFKKKVQIFKMKEHFGSLEIENTNCSFPNLKRIWGNFSVIDNSSKRISTPNLEYINKKCIINSDNQTIHVESINEVLFIEKGINNKFPNLRVVNKLNISRNGSELIAPNLKEIKKKSTFFGDFKAESLETINVDYDYNYNHYLPSLKVLNGTLRKPYGLENELVFNSLEIINGDYRLDDKIQTPSITHIFGKLYLGEKSIEFKNLRTIGELIGDQQVKEEFLRVNKQIKKINKSAYFKLENQNIVETFYHQVGDNYRITKSNFYSKLSWSNNYTRISIDEYIRIVKMKHTSYQNFYAREVVREWNVVPNNHLSSILSLIEKKWKDLVEYNYKDLFTLKDQSTRRFSFNYVGVAEMMKALKAKRISSKGILVKHYKYDNLGNKSTYEKHNVFETYEADFSEIQDLQTWRPQKAYAVKCWCTSTDNEHWLWIEEQYKNNPLDAIASTFRVHENIIPHIKCLKRQGDILLCEMKKEVIPEGTVRPLTSKEYFDLLVAES